MPTKSSRFSTSPIMFLIKLLNNVKCTYYFNPVIVPADHVFPENAFLIT